MLERNTLPISLSDKDIVGTWGESKTHQITKSDLVEAQEVLGVDVLDVVPKLTYTADGWKDIYKGFAVSFVDEGKVCFASCYKWVRVVPFPGSEESIIDYTSEWYEKWRCWNRREKTSEMLSLSVFIDWEDNLDPC